MDIDMRNSARINILKSLYYGLSDHHLTAYSIAILPKALNMNKGYYLDLTIYKNTSLNIAFKMQLSRYPEPYA